MTIRVGNYEIRESPDPDERDPRGIIWVWEEPSRRHSYVIACDPTVGITGWHRSLRTRDDSRTDNCAIHVLRCGVGDNPDIQVAEFAAPIDAVDAAPIINTLGRLYGGNSEEGMAHCIIEVQPGPGLMTQRELINRYGYTNLFLWQHLDKFLPTNTASYGWYSNRQSRSLLWQRGTRHITQRKVVINSPWLIEEMVDCVPDSFLSFTSRARYGSHDDRVVSFLMGIWAANEWSMVYEPTENQKPEDAKQPSWQASDMSAEDMMSSWEDRFADMMDE